MPDWLADHAALCAADREHGLSPEDLERLAVAAFLVGRDADVVPLRERALQGYLEQGAIDRAVRCGFWCGYHLQTRGELAQAQGWEQRVMRLVAGRATATFEGMLSQARAALLMTAGVRMNRSPAATPSMLPESRTTMRAEALVRTSPPASSISRRAGAA